MTTVDELDKRSTDLEALVTDFPDLINLRFERVLATQSEVTARLNLLDRQLATLTRDVRDMRAAVTRQLLGQDERFKEIEARLGRLEERLDRHDARFSSIESKLDQVLALLGSRG